MRNFVILILIAGILSGCGTSVPAETVLSTEVTVDAYEILSEISEKLKQVTDPMLSEAFEELDVTEEALTGWSVDYYDPTIQPSAAVAPAGGDAPEALYLLNYHFSDGRVYGFILQCKDGKYAVIASGPDFVSSSRAISTPTKN